MRNRKNQFLIRMNDAEFSQYQNRQVRSGESGNAFCFACLLNHPIRVVEHLPEMLRQLKTIGNNLNQIAHAAKVFKDYHERKKQERLALANKWEGGKTFDEDFLFTTWNGHPGCPSAMNCWLKRFIKARDFPKISPHSFRHMAATYLITAGMDLRTVASKLVHSNSTTTQLGYSHLLQHVETQTANVMDNILQNSLHEAEKPTNK